MTVGHLNNITPGDSESETSCERPINFICVSGSIEASPALPSIVMFEELLTYRRGRILDCDDQVFRFCCHMAVLFSQLVMQSGSLNLLKEVPFQWVEYQNGVYWSLLSRCMYFCNSKLLEDENPSSMNWLFSSLSEWGILSIHWFCMHRHWALFQKCSCLLAYTAAMISLIAYQIYVGYNINLVSNCRWPSKFLQLG